MKFHFPGKYKTLCGIDKTNDLEDFYNASSNNRCHVCMSIVREHANKCKIKGSPDNIRLQNALNE